MHFLKEGQKIRAWVDPIPPIIRAMPERKRFFSIEAFPNFYLTAKWLEHLIPVPGVLGSNPAVSGVISGKLILAAGFIQSTLFLWAQTVSLGFLLSPFRQKTAWTKRIKNE